MFYKTHLRYWVCCGNFRAYQLRNGHLDCNNDVLCGLIEFPRDRSLQIGILFGARTHTHTGSVILDLFNMIFVLPTMVSMGIIWGAFSPRMSGHETFSGQTFTFPLFPRYNAHDGSMGRTVYFQIHECLFCMIHFVGKFNRPMDLVNNGKLVTLQNLMNLQNTNDLVSFCI